MAYQMDQFGNVIGEYESEEERRAREQKELDDTAVQTQEIKTYGDGTQEVVTKQEIPPELQRQQAAYQQTVAQVAPVAQVSPDQAAYTRQQESGNNPNIGYHFPADAQGKRQSSAFGPYGITEAAYKDIAKQDPTLAKPITQWTQEEHDRGYNTLVGRNQARLTQLGIDATPGALQLSHLLGPDGAAKFLKTGQVSEQAAAANGGAERLKQIAQGRFAGAPSASSGAAQPAQQPQAQPQMGPVSPEQAEQQANTLSQQLQQLAESQKPQQAPNSFDEFGTPVFSPAQANLDMHLSNYQTIQSSPDDLLNFSKDSTLPEWLKDRARNTAADLIIEQRNDARAQKEAAELDENKIAKLMRERRGEGSRVKGMLYAAFGLKDLANEELYKLGIGTDKADNINGEPVIVKVAANGKAIDGINALTGQELTTKEIATYNSGVAGKLGKGTSLTAQVYVDKQGNRYRSGSDSAGNSALVNIQGGAPFKGNPKDLTVESIETAAAKAEGAKRISLAYDPIIKAATTSAEKLTEANIQYGTNFAIAGYGAPGTPNAGKPILVDKTTNQIVTPDAQGKVTVNQGQPGMAMPAGGTAALATGEKLRSERSQAMNKVLDEEVRPQAQAGDTVSAVRKQQFAIFDRPGIDPNRLFGLATGAGEGVTAQSAAMLRDFLAGAVSRNSDGTPMNGEQLSQRFAGLNLTPAEKSALAEYNIANQKINAATLKQTAGAGSVTEAEQRVNRESNVDVTKIPALGAFNAMGQSQFDGDRARYKADWAANQTFSSALDLDKAWRKESQRLSENYAAVAKERIKFINTNGNTYNAVREGYRLFPVPEYDPGTETWKKTKPLSSFNR